jgi:hypothetical protein
MTKAERNHMDRVAQLPCAVCGAQPVSVHHLRTGIGMGRRATAFQTMPLCPEHHQGATGIHGMGRKAWERFIGKTEIQILEETIEALA